MFHAAATQGNADADPAALTAAGAAFAMVQKTAPTGAVVHQDQRRRVDRVVRRLPTLRGDRFRLLNEIRHFVEVHVAVDLAAVSVDRGGVGEVFRLGRDATELGTHGGQLGAAEVTLVF